MVDVLLAGAALECSIHSTMQAVEVEQNSSQKTLRHFNPANASFSNLAEILPAYQHLFLISHEAYWPAIVLVIGGFGKAKMCSAIYL